MLGGDDDGAGFDRAAIDIFESELGLRIRAQVFENSRMTGFRQGRAEWRGKINRGRHQVRRFLTGITEHDALISGTFVFAASSIDAYADVSGLSMETAINLYGLPVEAFLFVADFFDGVARAISLISS